MIKIKKPIAKLHASETRLGLEVKSGRAKKKSVIEYRCFGDSYYLTTSALLKGRGLRMADDGSNHKRGLKTYHATVSAFKKLRLEYPVKINTISF